MTGPRLHPDRRAGASPDWFASALCRGVSPSLYFPTRGQVTPPVLADGCRVCPHAADCLTFALDAHMVAGVWGALTPRSRRMLRRDGMYRSDMLTARWSPDGGASIEWHHPAPWTVAAARAALTALPPADLADAS